MENAKYFKMCVKSELTKVQISGIQISDIKCSTDFRHTYTVSTYLKTGLVQFLDTLNKFAFQMPGFRTCIWKPDLNWANGLVFRHFCPSLQENVHKLDSQASEQVQFSNTHCKQLKLDDSLPLFVALVDPASCLRGLEPKCQSWPGKKLD